jgi:hypothetical protein
VFFWKYGYYQLRQFLTIFWFLPLDISPISFASYLISLETLKIQLLTIF